MKPSCPKCGGTNTSELVGGYVRCEDCERREIQRTAILDASRLADRHEGIRPALREALDV